MGLGRGPTSYPLVDTTTPNYTSTVMPDSDPVPMVGRTRGTPSTPAPSITKRAPPDHEMSSRAKPRDLRRSSTPTALFTNTPGSPPPRHTGDTRYPRGTCGRGYNRASDYQRTPFPTKTRCRDVGMWAPAAGREARLHRKPTTPTSSCRTAIRYPFTVILELSEESPIRQKPLLLMLSRDIIH